MDVGYDCVGSADCDRAFALDAGGPAMGIGRAYHVVDVGSMDARIYGSDWLLMKIGSFEIGTGRCMIVAELGINHNGSIDRALEMVRDAASAGVDGIKIQAYTAEEFVGPEETYTYWESDGTRPVPQTVSQQEMFRRCQLSEQDIARISDECRTLGKAFIATATDQHWIDYLCEIGVDALKVGSDDIIHLPLLRALKKTGKPIIISTGMASAEEIKAAITECRPAVLLHCVSIYPTPLDQVNLRRMDSLWPLPWSIHVGFSDHTYGTTVAKAAIARSAVMIEKHFTLNPQLPGPDQSFSGTADEFKDICTFAETFSQILGDGKIGPGEKELEMRKVARRSIVAAKLIRAGETITAEHLAYRRPGTGISPAMADFFIGTKSDRDVQPGQQIRTWATDRE